MNRIRDPDTGHEKFSTEDEGKEGAMNVFDVLRSWIPTGTEWTVGTITGAAGAAVSHFLGWDDALEALCVLMVLDYVTGMLAAYISPALKLNSARGLKGICKKIMMLLLVVLAHELERASGVPAVQSVVVWFFIGNEGLSIIENAAKAGVPIPSKLRDTLEQLSNEKKGEETK